MIINFRYHIFTITAIFAALGLGILIGSSIIGNDGLHQEQSHIISNIRGDIARLKNKNTNLTAGISKLEDELEYRSKLEKKLFNLLLKDFLKKENLVLIYNDLEKSKLREIKGHLELMGAQANLINYDQVDGDLTYLKTELKGVDRFVGWNIDNGLNKCLTGLELKDKAYIEYNKGDVLGLMFNIINNVKDNKKYRDIEEYTAFKEKKASMESSEEKEM